MVEKALLQKRPFIIAGPCSAETEEQVLTTAQALKDTGQVDVLRAGIWKPRTRPGHFEGVGEVGLKWMQRVKNELGLPVAIEVANAKQVEAALKHDVDILWIGARSSANPISVQEIADSLKGISIPVFIKNPVNPDLQLWIGAVERIEKAGIENIGIIHRGFSSYENMEFRNKPTWQLAIDMKSRFPNYPFLVDPSHICGKRELLKGVTQNAIDLDYDGVMIESHIHPDEAWSDAQQQITPHDFQELLNNIIWRKSEQETGKVEEDLLRFRRMIDELDKEALRFLGQRMEIANAIGKLKKEKQLTILQTNRWQEVLDNLIVIGEGLGLSKAFIQQYFNAIHMESIRHQDKIMN